MFPVKDKRGDERGAVQVKDVMHVGHQELFPERKGRGACVTDDHPAPGRDNAPCKMVHERRREKAAAAASPLPHEPF